MYTVLVFQRNHILSTNDRQVKKGNGDEFKSTEIKLNSISPAAIVRRMYVSEMCRKQMVFMLTTWSCPWQHNIEKVFRKKPCTCWRKLESTVDLQQLNLFRSSLKCSLLLLLFRIVWCGNSEATVVDWMIDAKLICNNFNKWLIF